MLKKQKQIMPIILIILAFLFLISMSSVSAANHDLTDSNSDTDVQYIIDSDTDEDVVINLDDGNYNFGQINITRNITIAGKTKNGVKISRISNILFNITATNVKLINLTISGYQTAVSSNKGDLTITDNNITTRGVSIDIESDGDDLKGILIKNNNIVSSVAGSSNGAININSIYDGKTVVASLIGNNITAFWSISSSNGVSIVTTQSFNNIIFTDNNIKASLFGILLIFSGYNTNITMLNNDINGSDYGVSFNSYGSDDTNIDISDNSIVGKYGLYFALYYSNKTSINITNNDINGTSYSGVRFTIHDNNDFNIMADNNNIEGKDYGLYIDTINSNDTTIKAINNYITGLSGVLLNINNNNNINAEFTNNDVIGVDTGVDLYQSNNNNPNIVFTGNSISGALQAIYISSFGSLDGLSLLNNTLIGNDYGLYFSLDGATLKDILVKGNTIIANDIAIFFDEINPSYVNVTVNYNRILGTVGLDYSAITNDDGSNFDYNWWGENDISTKIIGFDTDNHYILSITNTTSLDNAKTGNIVNFSLLVLNTTLTNEGVENLPYFEINGTFNGDDYVTSTDDLFTIQLTIPTSGLQTIDAECDDEYVDLQFNALKANMNSTIVAPNVNVGKSTTIRGVLKNEDGDILANVIITVSIDGVIYIVTTNSTGEWSLTYTPTHAGNIQVIVSFVEDASYFSFTNNTNFDVIKNKTNSTIIVPKEVDVGKSTTIRGVLKDEFGNLLANIQLTVTVDGIAYIVTTNSAGEWSLTYTPKKLGNIQIAVKFVEDANYFAFTNSTVFKAITGTVLSVSAPTINQGKKTNIKVTLRDLSGNVLKDKKISLTINGKTYTATTNNKGIAIFNIAGLKGGKHNFSVKFAGDNLYKSSVALKVQNVKAKVDLAIISIKKLKSNKKIPKYKVTIVNKGSLKSKATILSLFHMRKGIKIKPKNVKIKAIGAGRKISVIISYYPDKDNHRYCKSYFTVDPKNKNKEIILANNKKSIKG